MRSCEKCLVKGSGYDKKNCHPDEMYGNDLDYCWCSKVDDTGKCTEIRNGCMEYQE